MEAKLHSRIIWIDTLKGITVLLVAIHHALLAAIAVDGTSTHILFITVDKVNYLLGHARMPAFFLAAGLVVASKRGSKGTWFLKKRLPFMLWIIVLWTLISFSVENFGIHLYPWSEYPSFKNGYSFPSPFGNLWFIYALLFLSLIAVLTNNMNVRKQVLISCSLSVAGHLYLKNFHFDLEINTILVSNLIYKGIPFFMAGFVFNRKLVSLFETPKLLLLISFFMLLTLAVVFSFNPALKGYSLFALRYIPSTLLFIGAVLLLTKMNIITKAFKCVGKLSLEVFLLHQFFIALFYSFYSLYGEESFGFSYPLHFLFLIFFPIVLCWLFVWYSQRLINPIFFSIPVRVLRFFSFSTSKSENDINK